MILDCFQHSPEFNSIKPTSDYELKLVSLLLYITDKQLCVELKGRPMHPTVGDVIYIQQKFLTLQTGKGNKCIMKHFVFTPVSNIVSKTKVYTGC